MSASTVPIAVAEDARGFLVTLPRQFWLVVGLHRSFKGVRAAEAGWTYRLPPGRATGRKIEAWIAEVELQARAEARRRSWTASDAEWDGAAIPTDPAPTAVEPVIVTLPRKRTARAVLGLLADLAGDAVLVAAIGPDGAREYRLTPSGRRVPPGVAARAIAARLLAPGYDDLFEAAWSQTWRAPTEAETAAAVERAARAKPTRRQRRPPRGGGLAGERRPSRRPSPVEPEEIRP